MAQEVHAKKNQSLARTDTFILLGHRFLKLGAYPL